jgi:hypothetical protein
MDAESVAVMNAVEQPQTVDDKEAHKLAILESRRVRQQLKYATDPEYREMVKARSREHAVKRRAAEKEKRRQAYASGEKEYGKPGRPRIAATNPPGSRQTPGADEA